MITRTVKIGNKDVKLACSAGTSVRYRKEFGTDMFRDMASLSKGTIEMELIEKLAYIMAKQANAEIDLPFEAWLDQFGALDVASDTVVTEVMDMMVQNNKTDSTSKKK